MQTPSMRFFIKDCNIITLVRFDHTEIKIYKFTKLHKLFFNYFVVILFDKFSLLPLMD